MPNSPALLIDGAHLTLEDIERISHHEWDVELSDEARQAVVQSSNRMRKLAQSSKPIYGVNTGFGLLSDHVIQPDQLVEVSRNLILSHAVGVGAPFDRSIVRAAMLIRANTLVRGYSGVDISIIDTLLAMINRDVVPLIPSQGSLGSSGDLAPLAHLALVLADVSKPGVKTPEAMAWFEDEVLLGVDAMGRAEIPQCILGPKDGLGITNGATFSAAILALGCIDLKQLLLTTEIAAAMSLEALLGVSAAYDARYHHARGHPGQISVAERIMGYVRGSTLIDRTGRLQDPYCLRCVPQVLGPVWDILEFVTQVVKREVNASTDNPLIFDEDVISGGNFHGEPLGLAADYLKIAVAEVGSLSERRTYRLTSPHTNEDLPPMLVSDYQMAGLNSGLMMLQYTSASLVHENQHLASPDTVYSVPTSGGQEDFNANSTTAARHLRQSLDHLSTIIAVELICAAQALDIRIREHPEIKLGEGSNAALTCVREKIPFSESDEFMGDNIRITSELINSGKLVSAVITSS